MVATLLAPPVGVDEARALARELLTGDRLRHTAGVAARAEDLAETIGDHDAEILVVAAWVHDIGYGDRAVDTGFHPLDGARFLDGLGWPARISALVAHHSGARFVARPLGLAGALARYPDEGTAVSDALTYADQTTGRQGGFLPAERRMAEMLARHGPFSPQAAVHQLRGPALRALADRVERRLLMKHAPGHVASTAPHGA